jgi:hypothetical protein
LLVRTAQRHPPTTTNPLPRHQKSRLKIKTQAEIFRALFAAAARPLMRLQGMVCGRALAQQDPDARMVGVWALLDEVEASPGTPEHEGRLVLARAVLLATGGCGGLYAPTTNPDGATADGVALAYTAGRRSLTLSSCSFTRAGKDLESSRLMAAAPHGSAARGGPNARRRGWTAVHALAAQFPTVLAAPAFMAMTLRLSRCRLNRASTT